MTEHVVKQVAKPAAKRSSARRAGTTSTTCPSSEAHKRAAVILEVLAGVRSPREAAGVLKISTNHYYLLERRALAGLAAACEPQPKGKRPDGERELAAARQALQRCQQECQRQAALVRATQRAVGVPPVPAPSADPKRTVGGKSGKGGPRSRRRRSACVRALRAAREYNRQAVVHEPAPPGSSTPAAPPDDGLLSKE